ncbi:MAG: hypothetical protein IJJ40_05275 [Clostridia bacterium]|nr:hypothetical protein [Clostridia bacterium]
MTFKICLAGVVIGVETIYSETYSLCKDYLCEGDAAFSVKTNKADIDFEREKSKAEAKLMGVSPKDFSDGYLETLAVYRKAATKLIAFNTFLMHGSAVAVDNSAYLFTAPSGTGKTTHTNLWLHNIEGAYVVNGDKPLISVKENGVFVNGTPWSGKEGMNKNVSVPLKAICVLKRGKENSIKEVSFLDAYTTLLNQVYRPQDEENLKHTLELLNETSGYVRFYELSCNISPAAAKVAFEGMR